MERLYFPLYSPKVPVPDGEDVLLVEQHQLLVVDYAAVQLRIVGLTQGDDVNLNKTQFSKIWNNTTVDVELTAPSCTLTLSLACSLLTMGSWMRISQPSLRPNKHS